MSIRVTSITFRAPILALASIVIAFMSLAATPANAQFTEAPAAADIRDMGVTEHFQDLLDQWRAEIAAQPPAGIEEGCGNYRCGCGAACGCGDVCGCGFDDQGPQYGPDPRGVSYNGIYQSLRVAMRSRISVEEFPGFFSRANDCWGYVSSTGREYALVGLNAGTAIVEVTNPVAPQIINIIQHPASNWGDVKVFGEYAYSVNETGDGVHIIDLSNVDEGDVRFVGTFAGGGAVTNHNIAINEDSGYAYLCGSSILNGGLIAMDLSDPEAPIMTGAWTEAYVHDAEIVSYTEGPYEGHEIAFLSCGRTGLAVVDVTDKQNMITLALRQYPGLSYAHQAWLNDDKTHLYMNDELDEVQGRADTTRTLVWDVSNLGGITLAGEFTSRRSSIDHNLYVQGDIIFEANYTSGLRIFKVIHNPATPLQVGWFDTYPNSESASFAGAWSVFPFPSGNVVVTDINRGLFILDPSEAIAFERPRFPVPIPDGWPTEYPEGPIVGGTELPPRGSTFSTPNAGIGSHKSDPGAIITPPFGDVDYDGDLDAHDLTYIIENLGTASITDDLNGDGVVDVNDLIALIRVISR